MFSPVWNSAVTYRYKSVNAQLNGFQRKSVLNEEYPGIVPTASTSHVNGILYKDIRPEDISRLDTFEGEMYRRKTVNVKVKNDIVHAETYVVRPQFFHLLSHLDWDPEHFKKTGIKSFIDNNFRFSRPAR